MKKILIPSTFVSIIVAAGFLVSCNKQGSSDLDALALLLNSTSSGSNFQTGTDIIKVPKDPDVSTNPDGGGGSVSTSITYQADPGDTVSPYSKGATNNGPGNRNCKGGLALDGVPGIVCIKGNYNQNFKRELCQSGLNPGKGPHFWVEGHYIYNGKAWVDEGSDPIGHKGVCVSTPYVTSVPGARMFHDGCSGYPPGDPKAVQKGPRKGWNPKNYGELFHGACVVHDLCFKAEPAHSGIATHTTCDTYWYRSALQICRDFYHEGSGRYGVCLRKAFISRLLMYTKDNRGNFDPWSEDFAWKPEDLCPAGKTWSVSTLRCESTITPVSAQAEARMTSEGEAYNEMSRIFHGNDDDDMDPLGGGGY